MKLLLVCLSLVCSAIAAEAGEIRSTGFHRFGWHTAPVDQAGFPDVTTHMEIRGHLRTARVGSITSVHPYPYELGTRTERPELIDDLVYESLFQESPIKNNEVIYPLVAQAMRFPGDFSYVVFEINPSARFNDGIGVQGSDVYNSYIVLRNSFPEMAKYLARTIGDVNVHPTEIRFSFRTKGQEARDLIMLLARMKIVKINTTGNPTMGGIPMRFTGTGPYSITQLGSNRAVLVRNQFYWGSHLTSRAGMFSLREIEVISFATADSVANSLGENSVNYHLEDKQILVKIIAERLERLSSPVAPKAEPNNLALSSKKSFAFNVTRFHVSDYRVRKALMLAYDFTLINQLYHAEKLVRPSSLLDGAPNAPVGPPTKTVAAMLDTCQLPPHAKDPFETYGNNAYKLLSDKRTRLLTVMRLMNEAGYALSSGKLVFTAADGTKTPMKIKMVAYTDNEFNQLVFYKNELARLGIEGEVIRPASRAELEAILESDDYDLAPSDERLISRAMIPRLDLAKSLFDSTMSSPFKRSTMNLNRLNLPCVDAILNRMASVSPSSPAYGDSAQALARIQQILYLNIFAGDPKVRDYFIDRRISVPHGLSLEGAHVYGNWAPEERL